MQAPGDSEENQTATAFMEFSFLTLQTKFSQITGNVQCYLSKALHMGVAVKLMYLWVSDHGLRHPHQTHVY